MTSISPVAQIVRAIRSEIAGALRGAPQPRPGRAQAREAGASTRMRTLIATRVKALDPADPDRRRKAFRIFLESVLLAELGENLINDAQFYELVQRVQETMEAEPALAESIGRAADMLLDEAPRRP